MKQNKRQNVTRMLLFVPLLMAAGIVLASDVPEAKAPAEKKAKPTKAAAETPSPQPGPKVISGMSILGNQEAPKSLVIAPWKSSRIGDAVGISTMLDDSRQPIDKEVFMRALNYYEIRSEK